MKKLSHKYNGPDSYVRLDGVSHNLKELYLGPLGGVSRIYGIENTPVIDGALVDSTRNNKYISRSVLREKSGDIKKAFKVLLDNGQISESRYNDALIDLGERIRLKKS